jgi:hypothetical protein
MGQKVAVKDRETSRNTTAGYPNPTEAVRETVGWAPLINPWLGFSRSCQPQLAQSAVNEN